ncbi:hypothetical protein G9A89_016702 [Geosiphon pyriformis]|nr:hypothetical protein G9A89_016702 [Geosiphon pyriformis]
MANNVSTFLDEFVTAKWFSDLDIIVLLAERTFRKKWFKGFDSVFNKVSSRFHKLELLMSKLVRSFRLVSGGDFVLLLDIWDRLDSVNASLVKSLFFSGSGFDAIHSELFKTRKSYHSSKLMESKCTEEFHIRQAVERRMESFEVDKSHTIRSILECPFHKVVLDYLVVEEKLVLKPGLVKSKPLEYIFDGIFSNVMCSISFEEMFGVVSNLPDGKVAGLSGITNELWKHCNKSVLHMLLELLNFCLICESVSMISKPYEWEGILMNTQPIALIETAHKILSDWISLACSSFDVLCGDNFSVLKGTTTQSPIFAISSVVENALEKNRELWLVLQDMWKAYNSVGWKHLRKSLVRIKMCDRFIRFFGSIHNGHVNRVMTDFGLTNGYHVHNGLDQEEVFLPLLWRIFYNSLLCEVRRQESMCVYCLISHFVSKTGHVESQSGLILFLTVGGFAATQYILDIASEFFRFNDISINNDKTVVISINCQVVDPVLTVSGSPISIAKKGELHCYLGIFLSSEGLSRPSLAKAHSNIRFFVNLILKKVILDKQFAYLVFSVIFPIIGYRTQFSFIPDVLICKGLKSKSGLLLDFPNDALHHPSLYNLKTFEQVQAKSKLASVVAFANSAGVLGRLFSYRSHDLQVFSWRSCYPLLFPVHVSISPSNNFLAGVIHIFSRCNLFLGGFLADAFCFRGGIPMSCVLGEKIFFKCVSSFKRYGIAFMEQLHDWNGIHWKRLDPCGPVPFWFDLSVCFLDDITSSSNCSLHAEFLDPSDVRQSFGFGVVCNDLSNAGADCLSVYTDRFLCNLSTVDMKAGAAVFFEDINSGLGVSMFGLVSSTLTELQAITLALECIPSFCSVDLFSDSQTALDAYRSKSLLVKGHSGILGNKCADVLTKDATFSAWCLLHLVSERFLKTGSAAVSGNSKHFIGSGSRVVPVSLHADIDWLQSSLMWHPNSHLASGFISKCTAGLQTYFMKTLYHQLPVAMWKHLYDRCYASVVCLFCGDIEVSNHVFSCPFDAAGCAQLFIAHALAWEACSGLVWSFSYVSQLLSTCIADAVVSTALCKGFVFGDWYQKLLSVFMDSIVVASNIVNFVCRFCVSFWNDIWLVCAKHQAFIKKNRLIPCDGSIFVLVSSFPMVFSPDMIRLLSIADAVGIGFGFHKPCLFFSGICDIVSIHIGA